MANRKGQITIFLIIGMILLISAGLLFYLNSQLTEKEIEKSVEMPSNVLPIKNYVESCIKSVGEEAILWIGEHGGYYNLPKYSTKDYFTNTAYYFYIDSNIMPSKERVEEELSEYMDKQIYFCLDNFSVFKEQGFQIEKEESNTTVIIRQKDVLFQINLPLTIKKQDSLTEIKEFKKSIDSIRLKTIYDVSKLIIDEQMQNFDSVCLSCIVNHGIENDLYVDMERLGNDSIVFIISDNNSLVKNEPYKFIFANKYEQYSCSNLPLDADISFLSDCIEQNIAQYNYSFFLEDILNMNALVNETFYYKINATGLNLTFIDYSYLFDVDEKTGIINFMPDEDQLGNHTIWIQVKDKLGKVKQDNFKLTITNLK